MSKKLHIDVDDTVLVKYLAGEASPEEAIAVDLWMEQAGNRRSFEELEKTWYSAGGTPPPSIPNVQQEWERWERHTLKKKNNLRRLFPRMAAACIVLLAAAALAYFLLHKNVSTPAIVIEAKQGTPLQWLPDSTSVNLAQNARLSYSPDFSNGERVVLLEGSAYFNVRHHTSRPFTVRSGGLIIQVIGTAFDVKYSPDSTLLKVDEGAVKLITPEDSAILRAGGSAVYFPEGHRLRLSVMSKTFSFEFREKTLKQVAAELEAAYDIKIVFENPALERCIISTAFTDKTAAYMADIIAASLGLSYRIEGNIIYFDGNECR